MDEVVVADTGENNQRRNDTIVRAAAVMIQAMTRAKMTKTSKTTMMSTTKVRLVGGSGGPGGAGIREGVVSGQVK